MNQTFKIIITLALSIITTHCDGSKSSETNSTKEVKINNMLPKDFYAQFYSLKKNTCEIDNPKRYSINSRNIVLNVQNDEFPIYGSIEIILEESGTYSLKYLEEKVKYWLDNGYGADTLFAKEINNQNWSIDDDGKIIFEGLGVGSGLVYNSDPAIEIKFTNFINLESLKGKSQLLKLSYAFLKTEELDLFCRIK